MTREALPRPSKEVDPMMQLLSLLTFLAVAALAAAAEPSWSNWRGPEQNGVSRDKGLPSAFDVKWKADVGGGGTPIVQNGHVYYLSGLGMHLTQEERVVCLDAESGKLLWDYKLPVFLTGLAADRLGLTYMA